MLSLRLPLSTGITDPIVPHRVYSQDPDEYEYSCCLGKDPGAFTDIAPGARASWKMIKHFSHSKHLNYPPRL